MWLLSAVALARGPATVGPVPDPVAVAASGSFADKVKADPEQFAPELVGRLVAGTVYPVVETRRIHDWIALNVDYDAPDFLSGAAVDGSWSSTLTRGSAVCEGYASLFDHLAWLAGLESRTIRGYARGV